MGFTLELPNDEIVAEAGSTVPLTFTLGHIGEESDQYEVQIEGVDLEWVAIPVPVVNLSPGQSLSEKLFFKPPRQSESVAGNYPFVLRVRSLTSGESKAIQGVLTVQPFHHLTMEILPKKGTISPSRKDNTFEATIMNLGNTEQVVQVFGNDLDDALTFTFAGEQVTIGPGQTRIVEVTVAPKRKRNFASSRLHGFTLGARSATTPSLVCSAQAHLEERAIMSPGALAALIFAVVLFAGWFALLPKPPKLEKLDVSARQVVAGETVTLSWRAVNAQGVDIRFEGEPLVQSQELIGQFTFAATRSGTITARAVRDGKESTPLTAMLTVTPKPTAPEPRIISFDVNPREVNKGDRITISYKVNDAVKQLLIQPSGETLDLGLESKWVPANFEGEVSFYLVARNEDGKEVESRKITVKVVDPTLPKIRVFSSSVAEIDAPGGPVTLTWGTLNAVRLELAIGDSKETIDTTSGSKEVYIDKTTDFTLTIYDSQDRSVTQKITVKVKEPTPPETTTGGAPPGATEPATAGGTR